MDGHAFIALAGKLAAASSADEATCRTAISRSYYGAFHVARSFLQELGFRPLRNANVHAFVGQYLIGSGQHDARIAGFELGDLQAARNHADYDLDDMRWGSRDFAMTCVEQAHRIVTSLNACRQDDIRNSMRDAITKYEQRVRPQ